MSRHERGRPPNGPGARGSGRGENRVLGARGKLMRLNLLATEQEERRQRASAAEESSLGWLAAAATFYALSWLHRGFSREGDPGFAVLHALLPAASVLAGAALVAVWLRRRGPAASSPGLQLGAVASEATPGRERPRRTDPLDVAVLLADPRVRERLAASQTVHFHCIEKGMLVGIGYCVRAEGATGTGCDRLLRVDGAMVRTGFVAVPPRRVDRLAVAGVRRAQDEEPSPAVASRGGIVMLPEPGSPWVH